MPADYRNMPPELARIMIEMSGDPEEKGKIKQQLALAQLLAGRATSTDDKAPSGTVGGIGHVVGKGILGYGAHRDKAAAEANLERLRKVNMEGRDAWLRAKYGDPNALTPEKLMGMGGDDMDHGHSLSSGGGLEDPPPTVNPLEWEMLAGYGGP